jgi:hypothetical protein
MAREVLLAEAGKDSRRMLADILRIRRNARLGLYG